MHSANLKKTAKRLTALWILFSFFVSYELFPSQALALNSSNLSGIQNSINLKLDRFSLPKDLGTVEEIYQAPCSKLQASNENMRPTSPAGRPEACNRQPVVLIQDAHAIGDAQISIRRIIEYFQEKYGINQVALEGTSGKLDTTLLRTFPDSEIRHRVFEDYLNRGELSGAYAASVLSAKEGEFYGVEDQKLYEENIQLYLEAIEVQPELLKQIETLRYDLESRQEKIYSHELLKLNRKIKAVNKNKGDLSSFLKSTEAPSPKYPHLAAIFRTLQNKTGDKQELRQEVKELSKAIQKTLRENKEIYNFYHKLQDYETEQISLGAWARFLLGRAKSKNLSSAVSKELEEAISREEILETMTGGKFFSEFQAYTQELKSKLFQNDAQRQLDQEDRQLYLLEKLIQLELTREEWSEVSAAYSVQSTANQKISKNELKDHLKFYETAEKREDVFYKNMYSVQSTAYSANPLRSTQYPVLSTIFVAGGFHTQGMAERLKAKGISYVVISPRIKSLPPQNHYRDYMQGKVSWSKYFEVKNGRIDLYDAFHRATIDKLVQSTEYRVQGKRGTRYAVPSTTLKNWRDQLIRHLASQKRIEKSGNYTSFLDRAAVERMNPAKTEQLKKQWFEKVNRFIDNLRLLKTENRLTPENIVKLTGQTTLPWNAIPSGNVLDFRIQRTRSETRNTTSVDSSNDRLPAPAFEDPDAEVEQDEEKRSELRSSKIETAQALADIEEKINRLIKKEIKKEKGPDNSFYLFSALVYHITPNPKTKDQHQINSKAINSLFKMFSKFPPIEEDINILARTLDVHDSYEMVIEKLLKLLLAASQNPEEIVVVKLGDILGIGLADDAIATKNMEFIADWLSERNKEKAIEIRDVRWYETQNILAIKTIKTRTKRWPNINLKETSAKKIEAFLKRNIVFPKRSEVRVSELILQDFPFQDEFTEKIAAKEIIKGLRELLLILDLFRKKESEAQSWTDRAKKFIGPPTLLVGSYIASKYLEYRFQGPYLLEQLGLAAKDGKLKKAALQFLWGHINHANADVRNYIAGFFLDLAHNYDANSAAPIERQISLIRSFGQTLEPWQAILYLFSIGESPAEKYLILETTSARSEVRQEEIWAERHVPEVLRYTVVSRQFEAGLDRTILEALRYRYSKNKNVTKFVAQLTMTGGLGALMHDLVNAWKRNGLDIIAIHPLYTDKIKGIVNEVPVEIQNGQKLGNYLREVLDAAGIEFSMNIPDFDFDLNVKVYQTKTKFAQTPLYYLDISYEDKAKETKSIFNEVYPDGRERDIQMAAYAKASEILLKELQKQGDVKDKLIFVDNEVYVSVPTPEFPDAIYHHINHTVVEAGLYKPFESSYGMLRFPEYMRPYIVKNGRINLVDYIAMHYDLLTGVGLYEHTPVLAQNIFPSSTHKLEGYNAQGIRSTNGAFLDQWQAPEIRILIEQYKIKLGFLTQASDEEIFKELKKQPELLEEFKARLEFIKAVYVAAFLLWMKEDQHNDLWLNKAIQDFEEALGAKVKDSEQALSDFKQRVTETVSQNTATEWKNLDEEFGLLRDSLLKYPIVSNVRRQVTYKGPEKWIEILESVARDPKRLEDFKNNIGRIVIGGRVFDQGSQDRFQRIKNLIKQLGLEDHVATIENYNIDYAPIIFAGVSGTVMLSDEFLEASATSMMKAVTNGGALIGVWGGAMPELFTIISSKTGKEINIFKEEVTHDQLVKNLEQGQWKITNGWLVKYGNEPSREHNAPTGSRRPDAESLVDALKGLQTSYQDISSRRELLFEVLAASPKVDMERGQARAHALLWQETIIHRNAVKELFDQLDVPVSEMLEFLAKNEDGFIWRKKEFPNQDSTVVLERSKRSLIGFVEGFQKLRARGLDASWSIAYHGFNQSEEKPYGEIFDYIKKIFAQTGPSLERVKKIMNVLAERGKEVVDPSEKVRIHLEAMDILEKLIEAFSALAYQELERYIEKDSSAAEFFRDKQARKLLAYYLDRHAASSFSSTSNDIRAYSVSLADESLAVAVNLGKGFQYRDDKSGKYKIWNEIYGREAVHDFLGDIDSTEVHMQDIVSEETFENRYRVAELKKGNKTIPVGISTPGVQILRAVPSQDGKPKKTIAQFTEHVSLLIHGHQIKNNQKISRLIREKLESFVEKTPQHRNVLQEISKLKAREAEEIFTHEAVPAVMALVATLSPNLLENMKDWNQDVYQKLNTVIQDPKNRTLFTEGEIRFHLTNPDTAIVFSRALNDRQIIIAIHLPKFPYRHEDGKAWFYLNVEGLNVQQGGIYRVRDLLLYPKPADYGTDHKGSQWIEEGWPMGVPVMPGMTDNKGITQNGWRFQILEPISQNERSELRNESIESSRGQRIESVADLFRLFSISESDKPETIVRKFGFPKIVVEKNGEEIGQRNILFDPASNQFDLFDPIQAWTKEQFDHFLKEHEVYMPNSSVENKNQHRSEVRSDARSSHRRFDHNVREVYAMITRNAKALTELIQNELEEARLYHQGVVSPDIYDMRLKALEHITIDLRHFQEMIGDSQNARYLKMTLKLKAVIFELIGPIDQMWNAMPEQFKNREDENGLNRSELRDVDNIAGDTLEVLARGIKIPNTLAEEVARNFKEVIDSLPDQAEDPKYVLAFAVNVERKEHAADEIFYKNHPDYEQQLEQLVQQTIEQIKNTSHEYLLANEDKKLNFAFGLRVDSPKIQQWLLQYFQAIQSLKQEYPLRVNGAIRVFVTEFELRDPANKEFFKQLGRLGFAKVIQTNSSETYLKTQDYLRANGNALLYGIPDLVLDNTFKDRLVQSEISTDAMIPVTFLISQKLASFKTLDAELLWKVPDFLPSGMIQYQQGLIIRSQAQELAYQADIARWISTMA